MELRSMPQTKILCELQLGNLWKMVHHPVFRHFKSWRGTVEETKKRESDHRVAKCHQFCSFVARKTLKTFSSDFSVLCHDLSRSLSFSLCLVIGKYTDNVSKNGGSSFMKPFQCPKHRIITNDI